MKISLEPLVHKEVKSIAIRFSYNFELKEYLKKFKGVYWSNSFRCFYVKNEPNVLNELTQYLKARNYYVVSESFQYDVKKKMTHIRNEHVKLGELKSHNIPVYDKFIKYLKGKRYSESTISAYGNFIL